MKKNVIESKLLIADLDITVRAKNVLRTLGIYTIADLHLMYLLDTLPAAKSVIKHYPYVNIDLLYSRSVNEEVKMLLRDYCGVTELDHVGAK